MTDDVIEILQGLTEKITNILDEIRSEPDLDNAKVVWPPTEEMSHSDAIATLFDIADCDLSLTLFDETGNGQADEWYVAFSGTQLYPNSPVHYGYTPLKAMIEEELKHWDPDGVSASPRGRILLRLLAAFDEP
jgi:hypothetical protein